ncbi:MAG TPA: hypothetical protein VFD06_02835 [Candidatus Polarisedimenticolia bacterium]|nr:hypothetical protein [Candidatus Polarisedimenticolia bacterium]
MIVRYDLHRRASILTLGLCAALVLGGCGGGGGGDDDDSPTCTNLSFDRAMVTPGVGDIYMDQASSTCSTLDVVVLVSNLSGIFTVGFDLTYPTSALQYQSYSVGPLMLKGNPTQPPLVLVSPLATGIQITMTRFGSDPPVSATGSEALISLRFVRTGSGVGAFDFNTGAGDLVTETVLDQNGASRPAVWTPNHGGMVAIP